jgi:rubrerythrin
MVPDQPTITSITDLLAVAFQIEADAVERYELLTDQMEIYNNPELADVFRDLAAAERLHRDEIRRLGGEIDLAAHARKMANWKHGESPEEASLDAAHYLMMPWHALQMALAAEKRALDFFTSVVETAPDTEIKNMAAEFVEEEAEHVNHVLRLLHKYPKPPDSWSDDLDPPVSQE